MGERVAVRLSQASTASGYLAAFPEPPAPAIDLSLGGIVLVGVADPGNAGTLIRTAAALALSQVVVAGGADPWATKVVQASAGAIAAVRLITQISGPEALAGGAPRCALVVSGGSPPAALIPGPRWLVIGGEANGIPDDWLAACEERLTLPMPGGTESLNAAVAGSIAAYLLRPSS
jgi:TrmH family RNA methyltransferase